MREFGQARNLMAETTGKEMVIRAASKRAGGRIHTEVVSREGGAEKTMEWSQRTENRGRNGATVQVCPGRRSWEKVFFLAGLS